jgi:HJR/Mrr/RecB family endonuclease
MLGIRPDASPQEVRTKYRSLIRRIHPDLDGPVALFRQVQEAYEVLSDPVRRADYDRRLAMERSGAGTAVNRPPSRAGGPRPSATRSEWRGEYAPWQRSVPQAQGPAFRSFPSQNPAGAVALAGALLVVIGAALGDAGWALVGLGCFGLLLGLFAGLGRYGTRKLGAFQRSGMAALDTMSSHEFEGILGDLFVCKGYRVARLGSRGEGWVGANLLLDHPGGPTVVQVKRWNGTVNHEAVQQAAAAKDRFGATGALMVTLSTYSPSAVTFANSCGVTLWNRATLAAELAAIQRERRSTGTRRLVSDLRAGSRVCLGVWVSALVVLGVMSRSGVRKRPTTRS